MTAKKDRFGWQANLPPRWLNDSIYRTLSTEAWALHTWTLAWGVQQINDGRLTNRDLPFIAAPMLGRTESERAAAELVREGIWAVTDGGFEVVDWAGSQPTARDVQRQRASWRKQKASSRPAQTPPENDDDSEVEAGPVPSRNGTFQSITSNEANEVNPGRSGQSNQGVRFGDSEPDEWADPDTGEVLDDVGLADPVEAPSAFDSFTDEHGRVRKVRRPAA